MHSSGLRDEGMLERLAGRRLRSTADVLEILSRQRGLNFVPGSRHESGHSDVTVLGVVVERAEGEPLGDFLRREVRLPLGMTSAALHDGRGQPVSGRAFVHEAHAAGFRVLFPDDDRAGGDSVYSSVADPARRERHLQTGAAGGRAIVDRMLAPPLPRRRRRRHRARRDRDTGPLRGRARRGLPALAALTAPRPPAGVRAPSP